MDLKTLGWRQFFETAFKPYSSSGYSVGRVTEAHKNLYRILTEQDELLAKMSGKMRHESTEGADFPAVGDWVVLQADAGKGQAMIHAILPRFSKFSRKVAGAAAREQVLAANIDTAFLVTALNNDFNLRRMERYMAVARESGAEPVILLNKADLLEPGSLEEKVGQVREFAAGVPVHAVSAVTKTGIRDIELHLGRGKTAVFLGSSGVGKSALVNTLLGSEEQKTGEIRQGDDRGRHTTVFQKMIILPGRGVVIDTPGLRELQLWEAESGLTNVFDDIEQLAAHCRFRDCGHENEPGCAVKEGISKGVLDVSRLESYLKLRREIAFTANRKEYLARKNEQARYISQVNKKRRH